MSTRKMLLKNGTYRIYGGPVHVGKGIFIANADEWGADPTGQEDSLPAIQSAIDGLSKLNNVIAWPRRRDVRGWLWVAWLWVTRRLEVKRPDGE